MTEESTLPASESYTPRLDDRICIDSRLGTIRYYGPIAELKGNWIGIEWDNAEWGKHSGEHNGHSYFTCRVPGAGSFIRHGKLPPRLSFLEALRDRYTQTGVEVRDVKLTFDNSATIIETVGLDKIDKQQSQLDQLKIVGLYSRNVARPDPVGEVARVAPAIVDLDLSDNLFNNWDDVAAICSELVHLKELKLKFTDAFTQLQHLGLTNTGVSWSQACILAHSLPQLTTLMLANSLAGIEEGFTQLNQLYLQKNQLNDESEFDRLNSLPSLVKIALQDNPLAMKLGVEHFRLMIIARLGNISNYNGSNVDNKDRDDCERYYLNKLTAEIPLDNGGEEERIRRFPRYKLLCDKHGPPNERQPVTSSKLQDRLLSVNISLRASRDGESIKTVNRRILGGCISRYYAMDRIRQ
ncbi:CAP Gly-rich domain-containing protein [Syncephalis plumigaleata]|nr:CAP Gly-rich domain-containing protein [Syncephalis plumigaleata]